MNKVIAIVGPTGVGKTKLSIMLAKKLNGEIINADSTQIYTGLDIATAKIKEEEKEGIVHHLFDIRTCDEEYTVYDYQKDARAKIEDILKRNKTPILVGGTGLYIKACLYDYEFHEEKAKNAYDNLTNEEILTAIKKIDPDVDIHVNNRQRLVRALNYLTNNKELLSTKNKAPKLLYDTIFIGLTTKREKLYEIIDKRVDKMIKEGLIVEAKTLYDNKKFTKATMTPIGYRQLFAYFDGTITKEEAISLIKKQSRNYAKRQYTFFNHQLPIQWFEVDFDNFENTVQEVLKEIKEAA